MNEKLPHTTTTHQIIHHQTVRFYRCKICFGFVESLDCLVEHWVEDHGIEVTGSPKITQLNYNVEDLNSSLESIETDNDEEYHHGSTDDHLQTKISSTVSRKQYESYKNELSSTFKEETESESEKSTSAYETESEESEEEEELEILGSFSDLHINQKGQPKITKRSARLSLKMNLNINQNNTGVWTPGPDASLYLSLPSPSEMLESPSGDSSFGCPICNIQFQTRSQLMGHTRKHMKDKLFQCKLCEQNFPTHKELKSHMGDKTETDEFSITCGICSRTFPSQACLTHHLNCHKQAGSAPVIIDNPSAERRYSCSLCSKTFKNSQHVQRHLRIHTGEKPFSCDLCGQSFSLNHNLQRHMRTHTGEKPHKCPVCAKEFAEGHNLKRHMISAHDGPTPYICTICNRKFAENSILRKHQNKSHKQLNNSSQ